MSGGEIIGEVEPWWEWPPEVSGRDDIPTAGYNVLNLLAKKYATLAATTKGEQSASSNH